MSDLKLRAGLEIHCPYCHGWHVLTNEGNGSAGTGYERMMLFWRCHDQVYFAGSAGSEARRPIREPLKGNA